MADVSGSGGAVAVASALNRWHALPSVVTGVRAATGTSLGAGTATGTVPTAKWSPVSRRVVLAASPTVDVSPSGAGQASAVGDGVDTRNSARLHAQQQRMAALRERSQGPKWAYATPLVFAPLLPMIRIQFRLVVACVWRPQWGGVLQCVTV